MGIKDLTKFLRKEVPQAFRNDLPLNSFGSSICIDVPIFAHKFCQAEGSTDKLPEQFEKLIRDLFLGHDFTKVYLVFDGNKTKLKEKEREKRQKIREKQSTTSVAQDHSNVFMEIDLVQTPEDILPNQEDLLEDSIVQFMEISRAFPTQRDQDGLWTFFSEKKIANVQLVKATQEAEAMCARLVREKVASICMTEDSDSLAFLCPQTILHYRKENQCIVDLQIILDHLKMSVDKFQDFCILLGCDFAERLPLVGPAKLMSLHQKWPVSDLRECAQNACKNSKAIVEHRNHWPFVKQLFETCGFEIQV